MKKLYSIIFALLLVTNISAQEHISFKGVPIDGTLKQYTQQMQSKGFSLIGTQDGVSLLSGDFAGYKGCTVGVATLNGKDLVSTIGVIFPEYDTWSQLYSCYSNLKDMLSEKYGEPKDVVEMFESKYVDDDNDRMYEVKTDRCKYISVFSTELGDIELSIQHEGVSKCFVLLKYYDKKNSESVRAAAMDDL